MTEGAGSEEKSVKNLTQNMDGREREAKCMKNRKVSIFEHRWAASLSQATFAFPPAPNVF